MESKQEIELKEAKQKELAALIETYLRMHAFFGAVSLARLGVSQPTLDLIRKACPNQTRIRIELAENTAKLGFLAKISQEDLDLIVKESVASGNHISLFEALKYSGREITLEETRQLREICEANINLIGPQVLKIEELLQKADFLLIQAAGRSR